VTLTGIPLLMFIVFSITVFVFSLVAAIIIAVLIALLFTVFCVGVALLIVLPTVFATTMGATFLFLWGLGGYYILKWFNSTSPARPGEAIGDKLNTILMQNIRNSSQLRTGTHGEKGMDDEKEGLINSAVDGELAKVGTKNVQNAAKSIDISKETNVTNGVKSKEMGTVDTSTGAAGATKGAVPDSTGAG
jgi:energy-coupling factor transporter transmembrane protein EcfT